MAATSGIERTLRLLTRTPNPAAIDVLDTGLRSNEPTVRTASARALATRKDRPALKSLLRTFPETAADVQATLFEPQLAKRIRPAAIDAIKGDDHELRRRACLYAKASLDHHLLPALAEAAQQPDCPHREALSAVTSVAYDLANHIHHPPPTSDKPREDPAFARRAALNALTRAVDNYRKHGHTKLIDAFLELVTPEDLTLARILEDATHAAHTPVVGALHMSRSTNAMAAVASALVRERPPKRLTEVLVARKDKPFLKLLTEQAGGTLALKAREVARSLPGFAWAEEDSEATLLSLTGQQQAAALKLAASSGMSRRRLADLAGRLLEEGRVPARAAACAVLGEVNSKAAVDLIQRALKDEHPSVVAAAASQLRKRGVAGSTEKLLSLLDHPSEEVQRAAQGELVEINYRSLRDQFESLDEARQESLGQLVGKADPDCAAHLREDLLSGSPKRRLLGLEMTAATSLGNALADELIALLADPDPAIRAAAAKAMSGATHDDALAALTAVLNDANGVVREVAQQSLSGHAPVDVAASLVQNMQQEFTP